MHGLPLRLHDGPQLVVEVDGGLVPVEDAPFEARATFGYGDGCDASTVEWRTHDGGQSAGCSFAGKFVGERTRGGIVDGAKRFAALLRIGA